MCGPIDAGRCVVVRRMRWSWEECATPSLLPVEAQSVRFRCNWARWPIGRIGRKRPLRSLGDVGRRTGRQGAGPDHSERTTPRPGAWVAPGIWPKLKLNRSVNLLLPHSRRSQSTRVVRSGAAICPRATFSAMAVTPGTRNGAHRQRSRNLPLTVSRPPRKLRLRFGGQDDGLDHDQGRRCDPSRTGCRTGHQVTNQRQLRANVQFCPRKLHLGPKRSLSGFGVLACFSFATHSRPRPKCLPRVPRARSDRATMQRRRLLRHAVCRVDRRQVLRGA